MADDHDKSKGSGYVRSEESEATKRAEDKRNSTEMNELTECLPYVGHVQKLEEAQAEFNRKFEKIERMDRSQRMNLYVKNLDDTIDDERLRKEFSPFGAIISAKVMLEDGHSKNFGFVCFSTPEEATKAMAEMNGRILMSKPLYVALAQRKKDRKVHLDSQRVQSLADGCMQHGGHVFHPGSACYFIPTMPQFTPHYFTPAQLTQAGPRPRWPKKPQQQPLRTSGLGNSMHFRTQAPGVSYFMPTMPQSTARCYTPAQFTHVGARPRWPMVQRQQQLRPGVQGNLASFIKAQELGGSMATDPSNDSK